MYHYSAVISLLLVASCIDLHSCDLALTEALSSFASNSTEITIEIQMGIVTIDRYDFSGFPDLETIYLKENFITFVHQEAFVDNPCLVSLTMRYTALTEPPMDVGGAAERIKVLDLRNPGMAGGAFVFPDDYFTNLPKLQQLNLAMVPVQGGYFPDLMLPELIVLNLRKADMPELPVLATPKLQTLTVQENLLTNLDAIGAFVNLTKLQAHDNLLATLPDLFHCTRLGEIHIYDNPLICDEALCWLRMWEYESVRNMSILQGGATCAQPPQFAGMELMDIRPTSLNCHQG